MAQFEEVLDGVRLALTWASPAEVRALLEGLVEERVISDAYGKSLSQHGLAEGVAPEKLYRETCEPGATAYKHQGPLGPRKTCGSSKFRESVIADCSHSGLKSVSLMEEHKSTRFRPKQQHFSSQMESDDRSSVISEDETTKLLRRADSEHTPVSDSERMAEGNSQDVKEWLERVEEAARRIAVPLWQHWDRGQRMLLPLVPYMTSGCGAGENAAKHSEAECPALSLEEETELVAAYGTLDLHAYNFTCMERAESIITLDGEGDEDTPKGLCVPVCHSMAATGLNTDHFSISGAARSISPVEACAATDTNSSIMNRLQGDLSICWAAGRTTTDDLLCLTGDEPPCGSDMSFTEDFAHLFSTCAQKSAHTDARESLFDSNTDQITELGVLENVFRDTCGEKTSSTDGVTHIHESKEDAERPNSQCGVSILETDLGPFMGPDLRVLPDDLSEYLNDEYLKNVVDLNVLFEDPSLNEEDELSVDCEDLLFSISQQLKRNVCMPTELRNAGSDEQRQEDERNSSRIKRRKRPIAPPSEPCTEEITPSRPKRGRRASVRRTVKNAEAKPPFPKGQPATKMAEAEPTVPQGADSGSEPATAETAGLCTTPPRILHLHPPIQFITIPDTPGYQVVQTLRLSPPVIRLPVRNTAAAPTYILVPAASPPCKRQVPPLSPVNGAVAPVQMSSSPTGSLSDTASKAMSPTYASPLSPSNETSICKESPLPHSPTALDIPQAVKDFIQDAKAHMSHTCQDMEAGVSLTSQYVNTQVSQREILRSGKSTNKLLDRELVIKGNTDRQKSLLGQNQIFEGSNGDKPRRYILLLGNAGMGKTTLIRKLCLDWSTDCLPQFDFLFLLDGKALTLTEPNFSLQTLLLNLSSSAPSCTDPEDVYAQILAAPKRVLIIFDGFDEMRDYESLLQTQEKDLITSLQRDCKAQAYTVRQLYSAILQRVILPGCTLLLSTRPRGTATQLLRRADSLLEMCGFTPADTETYLSQYFTDPTLRTSALDCLKKCSYLRRLCWNPALCQLVCFVLERSQNLEVLPQTLTGLCHQVLQLKMEKDRDSPDSQAEAQTQTSVQPVEETQTQISGGGSSQVKRCRKDSRTKSRAQVCSQARSRPQRARRSKKQAKEEDEMDEEEMGSAGQDTGRTEEKQLLSELSSLAWEGVKANSSVLTTEQTISAKLKAFSQRTGLLYSFHLTARQTATSGEQEEGRKNNSKETGRAQKGQRKGSTGKTDIENTDASHNQILVWANPFLQSYLAGLHLSMSRTVTDRAFLQTLPFQSGPKGRRRPQREELELTQRFTVGLLFHNRTELQRLHSYTQTVFKDMVVNKQALVTKHLEGLSHASLSPGQVLEACHYVYEASCTNGAGGADSGSTQLVAHLAANLPEVLTFHGVPLNPADVFAVQNVLERGASQGRSFCLDVEHSAIQISGLRALVGLNNINTYRACIADVIALWEQLEQSGEEGLLQGAVSKFKIHPLKVTQVCHVEHLAKLVNIHVHKRLLDSRSDSILAEGVPAVKELHKLEFELGPENGPLALPKLWELLPGLQNLRHLDLENSKIGDKGAEKLAEALVSLSFLEVLNLSQNCIGDQGVKKLATALTHLPKLHCLSLYSNVISDEGAESLAAVLPHVASLTDLDVKYNKLTDVGAQSLGVSLRTCKKIKTLRMWNQCIPYGVFERLQQQDSRILLH